MDHPFETLVVQANPGRAPGPAFSLIKLALPGQGRGSVVVHTASFAADAFDHSAFAAHGVACPPAIERSVRKRQAEYFHGRIMARAALASIGADHGDVGTGPSREPLWPDGFVGSISHTRTRAAAVAAMRSEVMGLGIDLENIADDNACRSLAATVVNEEERAYLQSLAAVLPWDIALTTVFSAKESFFKAAFGTVGRYFDFSAAQVIDIPSGRSLVRLRLTEDLAPAFARDAVIEVRVAFIAPRELFTYVILPA